MPYKDRCEVLRWSSLSDRRLYFNSIESCKTVFELNNLRFCDYFELASKVTRSNHSYKLQIKMAKCNCYGNLRRFKATLKSNSPG